MHWRTAIFIYDLCVALVLAVLAVAELKCPAFQGLIPPVARVPVYCAWFGALGGVIISLKGVYDHGASRPPGQWEDSYNLWHLGRPVSGAAAGGLTYLLLLVVNQNGPTAPVAYAAAFILGTQERRFFNFLSEVGRLIVQVPGEGKTGEFELTGIHPAQGAAGDPVILRGRGFAANLEVTIGGNPLGHIVVSPDGSAAAGVLPAHAAGAVDVSAANPNDGTATLTGAFTYT